MTELSPTARFARFIFVRSVSVCWDPSSAVCVATTSLSGGTAVRCHYTANNSSKGHWVGGVCV